MHVVDEDLPVDGVDVPRPNDGVDVVLVAPNGVAPPRLNAIILTPFLFQDLSS